MLQTTDLQYDYPIDLVATKPLERGQSRILKISRESDRLEEINWKQLIGLFQSGDTLVLNDSQVLWARLIIKKASGSEGEIFFLKTPQPKKWEVLSKNMNLKVGKEIELPGGVKAKVLSAGRTSELEIQQDLNLPDYFNKYGQVPLPPYIDQLRKADDTDKARYQNVWAEHWGSVAAPTAGLHFSEEHLKLLRDKGVRIVFVTLHVGAGTFLPIEPGKLDDFKIHSEYVKVTKPVCDSILKSQAAGKKVWACGTTVARALETALIASPSGHARIPLISPFEGETRLFISPGYQFKVVDGLLTNFHQPESSLLALVATFATKNIAYSEQDAKTQVQKMIKAYKWAIEKKFRLFSYGDLTVIQ